MLAPSSVAFGSCGGTRYRCVAHIPALAKHANHSANRPAPFVVILTGVSWLPVPLSKLERL